MKFNRCIACQNLSHPDICEYCTAEIIDDNFVPTKFIGCDLSQDQEAKRDEGKPKLTLVPRQIIWDIARVREYGNDKYGDPDNWKTVEVQRYRDAAFRHFLKYLDDPTGKDEESGLSHLSHLACNIAFLCELEKANAKMSVNEILKLLKEVE